MNLQRAGDRRVHACRFRRGACRRSVARRTPARPAQRQSSPGGHDAGRVADSAAPSRVWRTERRKEIRDMEDKCVAGGVEAALRSALGHAGAGETTL